MTIKKCRICGKEYAACKNAVRNPYSKTFRWQEVACSPECGSEYFRRIQESRKQQATPVIKEDKPVIADINTEEDPDEEITLLFDEQAPDEYGNE